MAQGPGRTSPAHGRAGALLTLAARAAVVGLLLAAGLVAVLVLPRRHAPFPQRRLRDEHRRRL